jgi:hypothetical protein
MRSTNDKIVKAVHEQVQVLLAGFFALFTPAQSMPHMWKRSCFLYYCRVLSSSTLLVPKANFHVELRMVLINVDTTIPKTIILC